MTINDHWRHHYIPEFYTKRWKRSPLEPLTVFRRVGPGKIVAQKVFPRSTGYIDLRQRLEYVNAAVIQKLETRLFSQVDTNASQVLRQIERGNLDLVPSQRKYWARFVMSLRIRHPVELKSACDSLYGRLHDMSAAREARYQRNRRQGDPPTYLEYLDASKHDGRLAQQASVRLAEMVIKTKAAQLIAEMHWGTIELPYDTKPVLTSDRPVIWLGAPANDEFLLLLPLGPKRIFFACHKPSVVEWVFQLTPNRLRSFINDQVVKRAVNYVYGIDATELHLVKAAMSLDLFRPLAESADDHRRLLNRAMKKALPRGRLA